MKRKILRKREIRELNELIVRYGFQFDKKDNVEIVEVDERKVIKSNNGGMFFYLGDEIIPSLRLVLSNKINLKKIIVDMGAVKFVVNGADIMRPGVVEVEEEIEKGEIIEIIDVNNRKPLAIGRALCGSEEMKNKEEGKVVKNLHFVGDGIYNA
jgi:PUA-domain protein